ncbi:MAG: hypothetical protein ACRDST_09380 [Pseudonocardiaceae bacterium]
MSPGTRHTFRKLVRDRIPVIINGNGEQPSVRRLSDAEFLDALFAKAREELVEVRAAPPSEQLEELADLFQVVLTLIETMGFSLPEVAAMAERKGAEYGAFEQRLWLDHVDSP